jgi:hypothetical protein
MTDLLQLPGIFYKNRCLVYSYKHKYHLQALSKPGHVMCISIYQRSIMKRRQL